MPNLRSLAFRSDGRPRNWLIKLLLKDATTGQPRHLFRRVLFKKSGRARLIFADWYEQFLHDPDTARFSQYYAFLRGQIASGALGRAKTLQIVTTAHTEAVGIAMSECLSDTRLSVSRTTVMPEAFEHDLYIVVAPQMFDRLPPPERRILMQMEQVRASEWVTPGYLDTLNASLAILDYAQANIGALATRGLPVRQLYFVPILPYRPETPPSGPIDRDIELLFYGAATSDRRKRLLKALSERFNLRVETDLFGPDLLQVLGRTKVVVNIHFYDNALLETTRIFEALRHGAAVVSETSVDQEAHGALDGLVSFVPCGDVEALLSRVGQTLSAGAGSPDLPIPETLSGTRYHLLRALNGIGVLSFDELIAATSRFDLPAERIVLTLPEQTERYAFARSKQLPGSTLFHGLRHIDGWKGCAQSYKFLATVALRSPRARLLVHEDDAEFPVDMLERLDRAERYLDRTPLAWDVFSGLITDLQHEPEVHAIRAFEGEEYVHLQSFMGLVFCIYHRSMLEMIARYEVRGLDIQKHTIDRYLESLAPRCITPLTPLVGHAREFRSSIWNNANDQVADMIANSNARLLALRDAYFARTAEAGTGGVATEKSDLPG